MPGQFALRRRHLARSVREQGHETTAIPEIRDRAAALALRLTAAAWSGARPSSAASLRAAPCLTRAGRCGGVDHVHIDGSGGSRCESGAVPPL